MTVAKPFMKKTRYFKSKSDAGTKYKTERHQNGHITCFCPGFVYRQTCRHVEAAKNWK